MVWISLVRVSGPNGRCSSAAPEPSSPVVASTPPAADAEICSSIGSVDTVAVFFTSPEVRLACLSVPSQAGERERREWLQRAPTRGVQSRVRDVRLQMSTADRNPEGGTGCPLVSVVWIACR